MTTTPHRTEEAILAATRRAHESSVRNGWCSNPEGEDCAECRYDVEQIFAAADSVSPPEVPVWEVLADLQDRMTQAKTRVSGLVAEARLSDKVRLGGKEQGIGLCLDYLRDAMLLHPAPAPTAFGVRDILVTMLAMIPGFDTTDEAAIEQFVHDVSEGRYSIATLDDEGMVVMANAITARKNAATTRRN